MAALPCTDTLERDGFAIVPDVLNAAQIDDLTAAIAAAEGAGVRRAGVRRAGGSVYAMRNLLDVLAVRDWAASSTLRALIEPMLGPNCFAARGILFDKTPEANWKVVWHQDLSIAVRQKLEVEGFGPWSLKAGVPHVQPPVGVLEQMLTLRLHLDDCDACNGPLQVIPGSHRSGRFDAAAIQRWREQHQPQACLVSRGGVLLMRPLLLHASSASQTPRHRRVVHLEYAAGELPGGLVWRL